MATGREVIAYDRLGFGRSSARSGLPSMGFIAEEGTLHFPTLRDALGLSRYALFGHSVGGAMAIAIAANDRRCEVVVTESAQAFVEEHTRRASALQERSSPIRRSSRSSNAGMATRRGGCWRHGPRCGWRRSSGRGASMRCCRASPAQVLAIHGDRDEYGSVAFPHRIAALAGGPSEAVILEGCGHVPHRERREEVLQLASGHLAPRDVA